MKIQINRFKADKDWTLGRLSIDGVLDGYVVEDELRSKKVKGETAIWSGTYPLASRFSPKFSNEFYWNGKILISKSEFNDLHPTIKIGFKPHELIWIKGIRDFEYVLIHWGNTDLDSDGCLIIGSKIGIIKGREGVLNSRNYYKKFYQKVFPLLNEDSKIIITNQ
jgi:Family of unknown function (DUF5675)